MLLVRNILIQLQQRNFWWFIFVDRLWVLLDFLILLVKCIAVFGFLKLKSHVTLEASHHWSSGIYVFIISGCLWFFCRLLLLSDIVRWTIWGDVVIRKDLRRSNLLFSLLQRWLNTLPRRLRPSIVIFMSSSRWQQDIFRYLLRIPSFMMSMLIISQGSLLAFRYLACHLISCANKIFSMI